MGHYEADQHTLYGSPEKDERMKGVGNLFEDMMAPNFPNIRKEVDIQIQQIQRAQNMWNLKFTPIHIIILWSKLKGNFESSRRKVTYPVLKCSHKITRWFLSENITVQGDWMLYSKC